MGILILREWDLDPGLARWSWSANAVRMGRLACDLLVADGRAQAFSQVVRQENAAGAPRTGEV